MTSHGVKRVLHHWWEKDLEIQLVIFVASEKTERVSIRRVKYFQRKLKVPKNTRRLDSPRFFWAKHLYEPGDFFMLNTVLIARSSVLSALLLAVQLIASSPSCSRYPELTEAPRRVTSSQVTYRHGAGSGSPSPCMRRREDAGRAGKEASRAVLPLTQSAVFSEKCGTIMSSFRRRRGGPVNNEACSGYSWDAPPAPPPLTRSLPRSLNPNGTR